MGGGEEGTGPEQNPERVQPAHLKLLSQASVGSGCPSGLFGQII